MFLPALLASALIGPGPQARPPVVGDRLAPFTMGDYSYRPGRATVLTVWAYWCDTWKAQDERMREVKKATKGLPVDFLAISIDGRWTDLARPPEWARRLTDRGAEWSRRLHIDRVPFTMVVGPDGAVRWAKDGIIRSADVLGAIRQSDSSAGATVYLTFDDFPSGTPVDHELLDALRAAGVKATFFCIGDNARKYPALMKRAAKEGHSLQVHGLHHVGAVAAEKCADLIASITGQHPRYLREPGKSAITGLDGKSPLGFSTINPYDYKRPGSGELLRRILNGLRPGAVIQLHAGVNETVTILPQVFQQATARELKLGPVGGE